MNLILIGFKNCGKTTFAKAVSKRLNRAFLDVDELIQEQFFLLSGLFLPIYEIYAELGEGEFRKREKQVIVSISPEKPIILAAGGGSILDQDNVATFKKLGKLVYLDVDFEVLQERILTLKVPSFLDKKDPLASFKRMYDEREAIYRGSADVSIALKGKKEEEIIQFLCREWE